MLGKKKKWETCTVVKKLFMIFQFKTILKKYVSLSTNEILYLLHNFHNMKGKYLCMNKMYNIHAIFL